MSAHLILGIDIGLTGSVAILDAEKRLIEVVDMPVLADGPSSRRTINAPLLAEIVAKSHASKAFVEGVGPRPGEGAVGAFGFGRSRGVYRGRPWRSRCPGHVHCAGKLEAPSRDPARQGRRKGPGAQQGDLNLARPSRALRQGQGSWPRRGRLDRRRRHAEGGRPMTSRVLLNAVLHKPAARRISKAGKPYLIATVRDGAGPDAKWWTVFAFSESAIEALEPLNEGEAIAASGTFEASVWAPEGREPRVNLTMTADAILSARKPKKERKAEKPRGGSASERSSTGREIALASWAAPSGQGGARGDDDIPF
jgi:hypothetical protein